MADNPLDSLLSLEDEYYNEGFALGISDGQRAGCIEGRLFGLEKGFEKYLEMGTLHGRSIVWGSRLCSDESTESSGQIAMERIRDPAKASTVSAVSWSANLEVQSLSSQGGSLSLSRLEKNPRIEKHIRTFHALVEPESLSTHNNEDDVSEFDDRLKRAYGKAKIIERIIGEESIYTNGISNSSASVSGHASGNPDGGDGSIEDVSAFQVRH